MAGILAVPLLFLLASAASRITENRITQVAMPHLEMTNDNDKLPGEGASITSEDTFVAEKRISCPKLNGDICGCIFNDCSYHVAGDVCLDQTAYCDAAFRLRQSECRRKGAYYSFGGIICLNSAHEGDCELDNSSKSNFGINFNGEQYIDSHGIKFAGHNDTMQPIGNNMLGYKNASNYGTSICKREGRGNVVYVRSYTKNMTEEDKKYLLWTYVESPHMPEIPAEQNTGCLSLPLAFYEDGLFELSFKIAEMEFYYTKYRQFNVKLNGKLIFPEVDVAKLVGKHCYAVDLILNFRILNHQRIIEISGFPPMELINVSSTTVEVCPSQCKDPVMYNGFILNAVSVIKLGPLCKN